MSDESPQYGEPLDLDAIEARLDSALGYTDHENPPSQMMMDNLALIAEVRRLRAELAEYGNWSGTDEMQEHIISAETVRPEGLYLGDG